ncbi:redoxin family protein [Rubritalea tangerina]|uniref:Redoxin family protein n=2 Tax=Rubritalea tangerina TaxID=430798 RepID=A0ABW4Z6A3_9BACT
MLTKSICTSLAALTLTAAAAPQKVTTLDIGASAPDFSLKATDGKTYTLNSFKDAKYLVTVFTCNHCPDAIAARDKINQFAKDYKNKDVEVVAISSASMDGVQIWENAYSKFDDDFESMKKVSKAHNLSHPYLYDGDAPQSTSLAYGAVATPHVFIFGPERKLLYQGQFDDGKRNPGPAKTKTVINTMEEILAGKPVSRPKTRVFGCSTKWYWKKGLVTKYNNEWNAKPVSVAPIDTELARSLAKNETGKMRLINLWSTTCGPCVAEFPMLVDTYQRHTLRPFELITISIDDKADADKVSTFVKEQHLPLSRWTEKSVQQEGRTTNNFHFQGEDLEAFAKAIDPEWQGPIPHTVLIAPGGKVVWRHTGALDEQALRNAILDEMAKANIR